MEDKRMEEVLAELTDMDAKRASLEKELNELRIKNIGKLENQRAKTEADDRLRNRNKQFITAQSARVQAETTMAVRNHIAKFIQEESKEGRTQLDYSIFGVCEKQVKEITDELIALGYDVDLDSEQNILTIKW